MVLLAAGVGIGLGDGDEFDDVGCSVAQKPGRAAHGKTDTLTRLRVASARQEGETLPSEVAETSRAEENGDGAEPNVSLAAKVFELLTALDPDSRLRKAPPIKVFLLRFRQNLSRAEIGRICRCDKSLVGVRLKTIQDKLPWRPQQLRELSAQVEAMQDAVSDSRARRIYRKGAASGDEDDGGE
jgi:hypothetical protein